MPSRIDWTSFVIAIVGGVLIGVGISLLARVAGLSGNFVGPLTGGISGGLVPLIYTLRTRKPK